MEIDETHEPEPIEGKVARVLNTRELVINRGSEHGVRRDMIFEVLDDTGSEIPDPDTGEVIGSVFRPKLRVKVFIVEPGLSVARTYRTRTKNLGGTGFSLGALASIYSAPPRWVEVPETFKTEEAAWENIDEDKSFVKTGDPVRQVITRRWTPKVLDADEAGEVEDVDESGIPDEASST